MEGFIRLANPHDGAALVEIYAPYVRDEAVSFEVEVPSAAEFSRRIETISGQYPYLVYAVGDEIAGYAYASKYRERAAYCYDADLSIYVSPKYHGTGVAQKLYSCLLELLKALGYYNVYAALTVPNEKSRRFHEKCGFSLIGSFHRTGYKFGRWYDVAWFEKAINHAEAPGPVRSISDLPDEELEEILKRYSK